MTRSDTGRLYTVVSYLLWPAFFLGGLVGAYLAFRTSLPLFWFNVVYLGIVTLIGVSERIMPYERTWLAHDGETFNDFAHTLLNKGGVQIAAAIGTSFPMAVATVALPLLPTSIHLWPDEWPLFAQVGLGLIVAELGLYVAHRVAHENLALWRFHALHHSVERLWVVNTGRFHFVDSLFKIVLSQIPLYLLGAPLPVFLWIGAVTAFIGLLTHCNLDVRTGPLDWVLSTPRLHRWHHSRLLAEGNTNYGENLVLWDQIFGTYFNPPRPSSINIGISGRVAKGFLAQIAQPFSARGARQILGRAPTAAKEGVQSVPETEEPESA
jgi:sterol desaturase/sphingolipid hydroxylase (fatty acid hydroxylase superfamily)